MIGEWLKPVLEPIGISAVMSVVLLFGFVAKEIVIGAIVAMTGLQGAALNGYLATQMDAYSGDQLYAVYTVVYALFINAGYPAE